MGFIFLIIIVGCIAYFALLKKDPNLLQTEWYRLANKQLEIIAEQGEAGEKKIIESSISVEISNQQPTERKLENE